MGTLENLLLGLAFEVELAIFCFARRPSLAQGFGIIPRSAPLSISYLRLLLCTLNGLTWQDEAEHARGLRCTRVLPGMHGAALEKYIALSQ